MKTTRYLSKSFVFSSCRSHLVRDQQYPIMTYFETIFSKSLQILRNLSRNTTQLEKGTRCFDFPVSFKLGCLSKSRLISYRPGIINKVTSTWAKNTLAGFWSKEVAGTFMSKRRKPLICFVGFVLAKKSSLLTEDEECEGLAYLIRDSFASVKSSGISIKTQQNLDVMQNISLSNLKFGKLIAKGCNAAVYSACLDDGSSLDSAVQNTVTETIKEDIEMTNTSIPSKIIMSHSEGTENVKKSKGKACSVKNKSDKFDNQNIAVKVMFNYSVESQSYAIWNAMYKETLPAIIEPSFPHVGIMEKRKKLKPHPNIIEMYCAFSDQLPLLPDAHLHYPSALPKRLLSDGLGRNMTLFILQKRYHSDLREYLKSQTPTSDISLLILTQLLEGVVHLVQNNVAHRDLKSDNILLDLSEGDGVPKLAITDFGCCLESLQLEYKHYDIQKGGNMALMAPEVINAEVGLFSCIDYSKADLWTAGTLAYEIYGGKNPFYNSGSKLNSAIYAENDLPPFPAHAPRAVKKLVADILQKDPNLRPNPSFAATVCQLLLYAPLKILMASSGKKRKKLLDWIHQMSAETFLEALVTDPFAASLEFELHRTFCLRMQYLEIVHALEYINNA